MQISEIGNLQYKPSNRRKWDLYGYSQLDFLKLRNSTRFAPISSLLQGLPYSSAYVLSPSLMNAIQDSKAMSPQIIRNYESKLKGVQESLNAEKTQNKATTF